MAANPEDFRIERGALKGVSNDYIKKNNGYFEIPHSVSIIYTFCFHNCRNLEQVIIPNSVQKIEVLAFSECTNLKQATIHDSVITIGALAFDDCPEDLEITIIASDASEEKAQKLKKQLQEKYPNMSIHIDSPYNNIKGDSSSPTFFSQPSNPEGGEPSSNNQNQPGA